MEVAIVKKLLILGALLSTVSFANVIEVRIGGDLSNKGKYEGGFSNGAELSHNAIKKGFELSAEYRASVTENFELGGGISYKGNRLNSSGYTESDGIDSVPVYLTARYNFNNSTEFTPYIKANLGYAFNSGNLKWYDSSSSYGEAKFKGGFYSGIGTGLEFRNFVVDLSYNWNSLSVERKFVQSSVRAEDDFTLSHGVLTLGVGYSFGF